MRSATFAINLADVKNIVFKMRMILLLPLIVLVLGCERVDSVGDVNPTEVIGNLIGNIQLLVTFVTAVAYIMGVVMILGAVWNLRRYSQGTMMMYQPLDVRGPMIKIFCGAALLYLPNMLQIWTQTMFFESVPEQMGGYDFIIEVLCGSDDEGCVEQGGEVSGDFLIASILILAKLVGVISFCRGWLLLSRTGQESNSQPGMMSKAFIHIIAGILCFHAFDTFELVAATLGL